MLLYYIVIMSDHNARLYYIGIVHGVFNVYTVSIS